MSVNVEIFSQLTNRCSSTKSQIIEMNYSGKINGNGLFLKHLVSPLPVGHIVFEEYPIGTTGIAYFVHADKYCANCVKPLDDVVVTCVCSYRYCSEDCRQWADELYHKKLCSASNSSYSKYITAAMESGNEYYELAARLLLMFPNAPWLFHYQCPQWTKLDNNCSEEELDDETEVMARLLRQAMREVEMEEVKNITPLVLSKTIGMLRVNVLGLKFNDTNLGFAMYSTQSLMNHSGEPNCRCFTICSDDMPENPCLCGIEVIREIKPGEELTIDYVGNLRGEERRNVLEMQYGISED